MKKGATLEEGCYTASSGLSVTEGLLRLEPGVTITFAADVGLTVTDQGRIASEGTEDKPVTLTGEEEREGVLERALPV